MDRDTTATLSSTSRLRPRVYAVAAHATKTDHVRDTLSGKTVAAGPRKKMSRPLTTPRCIVCGPSGGQIRPTSTSYTACVPAAMPNPRTMNSTAKNMPARVRNVKL